MIAAGSRSGPKLERADTLGKSGRPADTAGQAREKEEMRSYMRAAAAGGDGVMKLQVSSDARDSYKGSGITVSHRMTITLDVGSGSGNPSMVCDLVLINRADGKVLANAAPARVPAGFAELPHFHSDAERKNAKFKTPQQWDPTVARPLELPVSAAPFGSDGIAPSEGGVAAGTVVRYERNAPYFFPIATPRRDSAPPGISPLEDAQASVPPGHGSVIWHDDAQPFTAVFEGKNSYGTRLAGLLHYAPRADGKSYELSGFYSKTSKPSKRFPLAGWSSQGGKVVLWLPGALPAAQKTGMVPRVASEYEPQVGAEGQLSFERHESELLLQGVYNGKPNPWAVIHRWVAPISVGAMVELSLTLTGYKEHVKWVQGAPTAPRALSHAQPPTVTAIPTGIVLDEEESAMDKIMKLKSLLDAGAITQAEIDAKKADLLLKV